MEGDADLKRLKTIINRMASLALSLSLLTCTGVSGTASAETAETDTAYHAGDVVTLTVSFKNIIIDNSEARLGAYDYIVDYDSEKVSLVDRSLNADQGFMCVYNTNESGQMKVCAVTESGLDGYSSYVKAKEAFSCDFTVMQDTSELGFDGCCSALAAFTMDNVGMRVLLQPDPSKQADVYSSFDVSLKQNETDSDESDLSKRFHAGDIINVGLQLNNIDEGEKLCSMNYDIAFDSELLKCENIMELDSQAAVCTNSPGHMNIAYASTNGIGNAFSANETRSYDFLTFKVIKDTDAIVISGGCTALSTLDEDGIIHVLINANKTEDNYTHLSIDDVICNHSEPETDSETSTDSAVDTSADANTDNSSVATDSDNSSAATDSDNSSAATDSDKPTPATDSDKPTPATDSDKPTPATDSDNSSAATDSDKPTPATDSDKPTPTTDSDKPKPTTDSDKPTPTTDSDKPKPTTDSDNSSAATDTEKPTPATDSDKPKPTTDSDKPTPATDSDKPTLATDSDNWSAATDTEKPVDTDSATDTEKSVDTDSATDTDSKETSDQAETSDTPGVPIETHDTPTDTDTEKDKDTDTDKEIVKDDIGYKVQDDDTAVITNFYTEDAEVVIPTVIDGKKVTRIDANAFRNNQNVQSVVLSENISEIGDNAFENCENLDEVVIGENVTSISETAFTGCSKLLIFGVRGSYAEEYAEANGIDFADMNNMFGDIDSSDDVDSSDALAALRYSAGLADLSRVEMIYGDVNEDEDVDSTDALYILRYSTELSSHENVGKPIR